MKKSNLLALLVLAVSTHAYALSIFDPSVPEEYRGTFRDERSGAVAVMEKKAVKLTFNGKTITAKTEDLNFKNLKKPKNLLYVGDKDDKTKVREVFLIIPNTSTRKEEAGLIWYNAEIVYLQFDDKLKDPAQYVGMVHAVEGQVLLDVESETFQVGWPGNQEEHNMLRQAAPQTLR